MLLTAGLSPIVYLCADEVLPTTEDFAGELGLLTAVRAEQTGGDRSALGIGHRVDGDGLDHVYVFVRGLDPVPAELRADVEERFGVPQFATGVG